MLRTLKMPILAALLGCFALEAQDFLCFSKGTMGPNRPGAAASPDFAGSVQLTMEELAKGPFGIAHPSQLELYYVAPSPKVRLSGLTLEIRNGDKTVAVFKADPSTCPRAVDNSNTFALTDEAVQRSAKYFAVGYTVIITATQKGAQGLPKLTIVKAVPKKKLG